MKPAPAAEPRPQDDDELIAYHESGHAVAMWTLGLGIEVVTIEPARGLSGYATHSVCCRNTGMKKSWAATLPGAIRAAEAAVDWTTNAQRTQRHSVQR